MQIDFQSQKLTKKGPLSLYFQAIGRFTYLNNKQSFLFYRIWDVTYEVGTVYFKSILKSLF